MYDAEGSVLLEGQKTSQKWRLSSIKHLFGRLTSRSRVVSAAEDLKRLKTAADSRYQKSSRSSSAPVTDAMDADAKGSEVDHGHERPWYIKWFRRLVGGHAKRRVVAAVETERHKSSASAGATSVPKALKL
ncbi:hypothetical protein R1flu_027931 [Riccia fluitans]|uniref:Uncharacterized protein n=1 Tax=Riccia fluitans TaxID=41844 RepID=A0ABD1XP98_9MARC